jgi:hypothetical protein
MQRCIAPEMLAMQDACPSILQYWAEHGMDIVVAADSTSVAHFCGHSVKLEVSNAKIIIPSHVGDPGPQQAEFSAHPSIHV